MGGIDIEEVAATDPDAILTERVNPAVGLQGYQCRNLAFGLGLQGGQIGAFGRLLDAAYRLVIACDASLLEINPLVVTKNGDLIALDAKLNFDDSALYRHPELRELRDGLEDFPDLLDLLPAAVDWDGLVAYWPGTAGTVTLTAWTVDFLLEARAAG